MSWIDKILPSGISRTEGPKRASVPEGVWTKCIKCEAVLYRPDLERNANVCPKCDHHMRLGARKRLDLFLDDAEREEVFADIEPTDRLRFRDKKKYTARLAAAQKSTGERDALVAMRGTLHSIPVVAVAFEFGFHGGSMGQAVGEKFARAAQLSLSERIPLICFAASGGARMQEALISLMQMAKTSAVIERMHSESIPYISVLTDPIYGGVSASLALLGDLNIAEPEARAGFAGPNIIEQTIRQQLPKGFQRSEFLLEHGAIDMIVPRLELRDTIARILAKLTNVALNIDEQPGDEDAEDGAADAAIDAEMAEETADAAGIEDATPIEAEDVPLDEVGVEVAEADVADAGETVAAHGEGEGENLSASADDPVADAEAEAVVDAAEDSLETVPEGDSAESDSSNSEAEDDPDQSEKPDGKSSG